MMVSLHESFHAYLNSSTCHGNAMIFAGLLAKSRFAGFDSLVARMIDASLATHETYATVAAVLAVSEGPIDRSLLAAYPGYQSMVDSFTAIFPATTRPALSVVALAACARMAMQTRIYTRLRELPCEAWPGIDLDVLGKPDDRFALLMARDPVNRAMAAIEQAVLVSGSRYAAILAPDIDDATARRTWFQADMKTKEAVSRAACDSFAESLARSTGALCGYDDQKQHLAELIAKVNAFGGDRLDARLQVQPDGSDDETTVLTEYRNEELVLIEHPQRAAFGTMATDAEAIESFSRAWDRGRYVQFVCMPVEKARALYRPEHGEALLAQCQDGVITGLRQRIRPPGEEPCVEFLLLEPDNASRVLTQLQKQGKEILTVCALSLFYFKNWVMPWLRSSDCAVERMAVLIDFDPVDLIEFHGARGAELSLTHITFRFEEQSVPIEVVCLAVVDEPALIYFTPCTRPFRLALAEHARRRFSKVSFDEDFVRPWIPMLQRVVSHALKEEGRFGCHFWS